VGQLFLVRAVIEAVRASIASHLVEHGLHISSMEAYLAYHGALPPFQNESYDTVEAELARLKSYPYEDLSYAQKVWLETGERLVVPEDPIPEVTDANARSAGPADGDADGARPDPGNAVVPGNEEDV
jgi:hypothetical protein